MATMNDYYTFETIKKAELCLAEVEREIERRHISFDDIERVAGIYDTSKWGSDASRRKRRSALARFKTMVGLDPSLLNQFYLKV